MGVSTLEIIVEDLKSLPTPKLAEAAAYIHRLRETSRADRMAILRETSGVFSADDAGGCHRQQAWTQEAPAWI